ncbi:MAG: NADH-quinone oxidoreductase subunit J [Chloroflexota bacterium]
MNPDLIVFFILAIIAVAAAVGMIISRNAVYSALYLILNFGTVSVFYLLLGAPFIAMAQITVYAGAIMVLFLFVIMLLGAEHLDRSPLFDWQKPLAIVLGVALVVEAGYALFVRDLIPGVIREAVSGHASPEQIGLTLFNDYFLPFQITAVLLLVAMIGAIVITKRESKEKSR